MAVQILNRIFMIINFLTIIEHIRMVNDYLLRLRENVAKFSDRFLGDF